MTTLILNCTRKIKWNSLGLHFCFMKNIRPSFCFPREITYICHCSRLHLSMYAQKRYDTSYFSTSTALVTDADGEVTQHVAYIPYCEVFIEERNGVWNTPYLFNAKELDEETGLYYYGARYLDPAGAMWLSVDPLFEKYVGMTPYNYCAGNPVGLVDPNGNAPQSRIEYRGNGTFGINKNNMTRVTRFYMSMTNNDPNCWRSGEVGLNTTVLSFSYKTYQYDKKLPGIEAADRNRTFTNEVDVTPLTKKGVPDKRYKPRTATYTYSYMGNAPVRGKAFAYGTLVLDAAIEGLQTATSCMMLYDLNTLNDQKNRLLDAINSVQQYLANGGVLPSEYNNSDGYGKLVDYVFQGTSGDDTIKANWQSNFKG